MRPLKVAADTLRGRVHLRDAARDAIARVVGPPAADAPVLDPAATELVLAPHLDDAVLSCWSTLVSPSDVAVVNVFAAPPRSSVLTAYDRIAGASSSAARMVERAAEDKAALGLAGRTPLNLPLLESSYRKRAPAVAEVLATIADSVPAVSAVLAPAGIGLHPDHLLVRAAALRLARAGVPLRLYADLPYCVAYGWPAWVTRTRPDPHLDVDAHWSSALAGVRRLGAGLKPQVHELTADEQSAKLAALRRYATQYATLSRGPLDVLADPLVLAFEVTWGVVTAPGPHPRGARGSTRTR